jgi:hypothetical protein
MGERTAQPKTKPGKAKMTHAKYQVEVWRKGGLVIRSEASDSAEMTVSKARILYDSLGITFTVFVVRDDEQFLEYEWDRL